MPDPTAIERPWIAAYPPGVPPSYRYPEVTLPRFVDDAARDLPDVVATRFMGASLRYAALAERSRRFAAALLDLGVRHGDRVALVTPNVPAAVVAAFGAWRVGAVVTPIDPAGDSEDVAQILADSGARIVVTITTALPRLGATFEAAGSVRSVIATGIGPWLPLRRRVLFPVTGRLQGEYRRIPRSADVIDLDDLLDDFSVAASARQESERAAAISPDDDAVLQYTGGTTAAPKGVRLTHRNLVANTFQARLWVPDIQAGHERVLCAVPFHRVYGLVLGMLVSSLSAATMVLVPDPRAERVLATIDRERPTLVPGSPALFRDLVEHPRADRHDLTSIRTCVSGGAPLSADLVRRFEALTAGGRLREGYGLTEASPLTHAMPIYGRAESGQIGLPVTDTVAIVVDPDDPTRRLRRGEPGELAVHGPQVMAGYWNDPAATAAAVRDGWLLTGDLAVEEADGFFRLIDRKSDTIEVAGQNVHPREIEDVLTRHPAVACAAVTGVASGDGPPRIVAVVTLRRRAAVAEAELAVHCKQHLPGFKQPDEIRIADELPMSSSGKLLRRRLLTDAGADPA